ncbi:PH domain-containing protein [Snuella sedimenti]|uniref:PH domain-containing protein n=1 Tax=Snuella sedimenti TaxID=2798802 RepID=A0A8J7J1R4_9FLAO|nr:PH domain-containing protein [Snuella sedimenti]MBJ6368107.1 PH domain-containing protein [Snuella sedimenti]
MKFKSKKDPLLTTLILGLNLFLIGVAFSRLTLNHIKKTDYWGITLILAVVALLFWIQFGTYYKLSKNELTYRSGPISGKIHTDRIKEIIKGKTLWVGLKPATSRKGLIIKYDTYNEIYISPKTNELFIEKTLEINSNIKITE